MSHEQFDVLSRNDMGKHAIASPPPVRGRLFIGSEENLFCIGEKWHPLPANDRRETYAGDTLVALARRGSA